MTHDQCISRSANRRAAWTGLFLSLAAILAVATPSLAQTLPEEAHSVATKKKQKPASKPDPVLSAAAMRGPSQASGNTQAQQAQSPLTPLWGVLNENYTNFAMGPLHKTQNILIVEPIIPLTEDAVHEASHRVATVDPGQFDPLGDGHPGRRLGI